MQYVTGFVKTTLNSTLKTFTNTHLNNSIQLTLKKEASYPTFSAYLAIQGTCTSVDQLLHG